MRVISLSCDGIFQAAARGLFDWLIGQDAEIICLQDLRARIPEIEDRPEFQLDGFTAYFLDGADPHRDGVAIYTRTVPKAIIYGFGMASGEDTNGRYLQADFESLSVVSLLAPQGTEPGDQEAKERFFAALQAHLDKITRKRRRYIYCGGWGMVGDAADVQNAARHRGEWGFRPEDEHWWRQVREQIGYADAFRLGAARTPMSSAGGPRAPRARATAGAPIPSWCRGSWRARWNTPSSTRPRRFRATPR